MNEIDLMKNYRNRWRDVAAIEGQEARNSSIEMRWKQLNSLYAIAKSTGLLYKYEQDNSDVWERWNQLRKKYHCCNEQ